jgi:hypothetical protein
MDAADRFRRDPLFASVVHALYGMVARAQLTPTELREAVILAAVMFEQNNIRPIMPDFLRRTMEGEHHA